VPEDGSGIRCLGIVCAIQQQSKIAVDRRGEIAATEPEPPLCGGRCVSKLNKRDFWMPTTLGLIKVDLVDELIEYSSEGRDALGPRQSSTLDKDTDSSAQ
jgi:hypothetical protein